MHVFRHNFCEVYKLHSTEISKIRLQHYISLQKIVIKEELHNMIHLKIVEGTSRNIVVKFPHHIPRPISDSH